MASDRRGSRLVSEIMNWCASAPEPVGTMS